MSRWYVGCFRNVREWGIYSWGLGMVAKKGKSVGEAANRVGQWTWGDLDEKTMYICIC